MKKDKLLPCPFCGILPVLTQLNTSYKKQGVWYKCPDCLSSPCGIFKTENEASNAWNKRHISKSKNLKTDPLKLKKNDILIGDKE